ncbi:glutamate racemase [Geoalkalibacter ferrihydriticus]|uniref:glutamate racemase n=1 Tax=Geoalkalibacter ferrihydriticus TaxID=392333 RepID=UPI000AC93F57|nr:glutamate racemase [Geoalkalibacter ferrihydriticus]
MVSERAIGVFDSGVGGLTVLKELSRLLPDEELIYLGDTARVPYGTKSGSTVTRYAQEAAGFLTALGVKVLVVACNTASAVALPVLEERFQIPVFGVIQPGAARAVQLTHSRRVGVIGTEGTIKSSAYTRAIQALDSRIQVSTTACPLFVPLAEEGWSEHPIARLVAQEYLTGLAAEKIDALVLGCTHYPLLKLILGDFFGPEVALVDSAEETAATVARALAEQDLLRRSPPGPHRFFVTDVPERFERVGGTFWGAPLGGVKQVEIG